MRPVCLITGASVGIGAALARVFAAHGHELVLTARRTAEMNALASEIEAGGHPRPQTIAADLTDPQAIERLADTMRAAGLEPSVVINNAGFGLFGAAADIDRASQLTMIDLNVRAVTDLSLRFLESVTRHRGGILNVASITAFVPGPGMAVYHATKAYIVSFSEALHQELAGSGVRVCALCPGPVITEFFERARVPVIHIPDMLTRTAERVAREGYEGFMDGHRIVAPGTLNRGVTLLPRLLPRGLILAVQGWRWARARRHG
jgi:short-subunit dehydrogenase